MKLIVEIDLDCYTTPALAGAVLIDAGKHLQHAPSFKNEAGEWLYGELGNEESTEASARVVVTEAPFNATSFVDPSKPIVYKAESTIDFEGAEAIAATKQ